MNAELRAALLQGRRRPRNAGSGSPAMFRGDGYEFAELRQYVAGDDVRRIDWAATARAGVMQTRVVLEDVALTLAAIVDDSGSMHVGRNRALFGAAQESMRAWYSAADADDRCARIDGAGLVAPASMRGYHSAMVCTNAPQREPVDLRRSLEIARAALTRGSALLVVSDFHALFDDGVMASVSHQAHALIVELGQRFDCTALIACDPWHDGIPARGFVRFEDAESGEQRLVFLSRRAVSNIASATRRREDALLTALGAAGWRTGSLAEDDGAGALLRAFGLR